MSDVTAYINLKSWGVGRGGERKRDKNLHRYEHICENRYVTDQNISVCQ